MREILFKGKRKDNGEWVEGPGINKQIDVHGDAHYYIGGIYASVMYPDMKTITWYEVIPETIGQYTGLKDKNGKKIFEGDVVKRTVYIGSGHSHAYEDYVQVVRYKFGAFDPRTFIMNESCEIIGNIHDNPELVEVK